MKSPPLCLYALFMALPLACTQGRIDDMVAVETGLTVEEPERGAIFSNDRITVRGSVTPSLIDAKLMIADRLVEIDSEGRFELAMTLPPGLNHIHTEVQSESLGTIRDTRGVLIGPFARSSDAADDGLRGRVDAESIATVGHAVARAIRNTNFNARLATSSREFSTGDGGCLSASGFLRELSLRDASIESVPVDGGIRIIVTLTDLEGVIDTSYRVACISGSSTIPFTADEYRLDATLLLAASAGEIAADLVVHDSDIDDFAITFTGNDTFDSLMTNVDWLISPSLGWLAEKEVGPAVTTNLADLTSRDLSIPIAGQDIIVKSEPRHFRFDHTGVEFEVASRIFADGMQGPGYPLTATDTPSAAFPMPDAGFALRVADEVFHQALHAVWNAGILTQTLDPRAMGTSDAGGQLTGISIDALLPPGVVFGEADEHPGIAIADLIIELHGPDRIHARVAVSAVISFAIENGPQLEDGTATLRPEAAVTASWINVLSIDPASSEFLDDALVTQLVEAALGRAASGIAGAFDVVAIPSFASTTVAQPEISTRPGTIDIVGALRLVE